MKSHGKLTLVLVTELPVGVSCTAVQPLDGGLVSAGDEAMVQVPYGSAALSDEPFVVPR